MTAKELEMYCRVELARDFGYEIDQAEQECLLDYESMYDALKDAGGC